MLALEDLGLFISVLQNKSFSKTARIHGLTTAAISKRISLMEKKMQVKLINRTTRKLIPTEMGDILYQHGEKIMLALEETEAIVTQAHSEPKGKLKVCSPTNFANLRLAPIVAEFLKKYHDITIEVTLDDRRIMPMDGDYDLVIRAGDVPERNVIAKELTKWGWSVCASDDYFKEHGKPLVPCDLAKHNCLDYNYRQSGKVWVFYKNKKKHAVKINGSVDSNNALFIKQMAIAGEGIVFLPKFMVEEEIVEGKLLPVLLDYVAFDIPVNIMFAQNRVLPRKVRVFIDFLYEKFKEKNQ